MTHSDEPGARYWSLVEPICEKISIYDGPKVFVRQFRAAPRAAASLLAAHWCQSEVCNGGLDQFFSNSTGVLAPEALEAYRAMGLGEWADILAEAMRFFGEPYPRECQLREVKLSVGDRSVRRSRFEALNQRFYDWVNAEDCRWERAADRYAELHGA